MNSRPDAEAAAVLESARQRSPPCLAFPAVCLAFVVVLTTAVMPALAWDEQRMRNAAERIGGRAAAAVEALHSMLLQAADRDELEQLDIVNQFFNRRLSFRDDAEVWGRPDYWASPIETLGRGAGDCEDFAVAKYLSLAALGVPIAKLRLVYVRAQIGGPSGVSQAHMVLAYYPTSQPEPLIADNLIGTLRPASRRPDLIPVFSFNSDGLWRAGADEAVGDSREHLSPWRDVLSRARAEGFVR